MKNLFIVFTVLMSTSVVATNLDLERTFFISSSKDPKQVYQRIFDYKNTCEKNCEYQLPSVEEMKIIEDFDFNPNKFYTWTFVNDFLNSKFFSLVEVQRTEEDILITQTQVSKEISSLLSNETGLDSSPLLDKTVAKYELTKEGDGIRLNYSINVSFSKRILRLSKSKIKKGLKKTAKAIQRNLSSAYPQI